MSNRKEGATYTMGRTQAETDRLIRQSKLYSGMTRRMLSEAGLAGGMRVLDIGSGAGDVAMAAAELVGPEGQVVGVDVNPGILETARARVEGAGHNNVEFVAGDARTLDLGNDFDALIGRFVLMYLADPAEALKHLATRVRPGGIVAFHEISFSPNRLPHVLDTPLADVLVDWTVGVFNQSGAHADLAYRLYRTYIDAGLPEPHLEYTALAGGWPGWPGYQLRCRQRAECASPFGAFRNRDRRRGGRGDTAGAAAGRRGRDEIPHRPAHDRHGLDPTAGRGPITGFGTMKAVTTDCWSTGLRRLC